MKNENITNAAKLGLVIIYSSIMFCLGVIVGLYLFTWI